MLHSKIQKDAGGIAVDEEAGASPCLDQVAASAAAVHSFLRAAWFRAAAPAPLATLVARRADGEPIAAIPLVSRGKGPLRLREVPGSYWPYRSFPVARDAGDGELAALLASPAAREALGPVWRLGPIYADDPTGARLADVARKSGWTVLKRRLATSYLVDLKGLAADGPWPSAKTLRKNRWCERRLAEMGALAFRTVTGADWNEGVLDTLAAIEAESWVGAKADARDTKFARAESRRIWEQAIEDPALAARLSCSLLHVGGVPAAFTFRLAERPDPLLYRQQLQRALRRPQPGANPALPRFPGGRRGRGRDDRLGRRRSRLQDRDGRPAGAGNPRFPGRARRRPRGLAPAVLGAAPMSGAVEPAGALRPRPWPAVRRWLASAPGLRLVALALLAAAGLGGFTLYESLALGWPVAREAPALFDAYHLARTAFAMAVSGLLVAAIVAARAPGCALERSRLGGPSLLAAFLVMAGALAAAGLLAASPSAFHALASEDSALEWASALLLLVASGLFARRFARDLARKQPASALALAGLLAAIFFVLGMEEISWLQRVVGFGTPAQLAELNWQAEFNFHNIQTDLTELVYYAGAGLFLGVLPLLRGVAAPGIAGHPLAAFVPDRGVAAVAAPAAIFTYGQWNLLPVQVAGWLTLFVLLAFARAARRRGDGREGLLFLALALAVAAGQALVLAQGPAMADLPDASEYKELFIAFGFAWYAATAGRGAARP